MICTLDIGSGKTNRVRDYRRSNSFLSHVGNMPVWSPDGKRSHSRVRWNHPPEQDPLGGGHNWQATAYSPPSHLYYFSSADGCQTYYLNDAKYAESAWYQLSGTENIRGDPRKGSWIAIDPETGKIR